jgi:hypothetical protein
LLELLLDELELVLPELLLLWFELELLDVLLLWFELVLLDVLLLWFELVLLSVAAGGLGGGGGGAGATRGCGAGGGGGDVVGGATVTDVGGPASGVVVSRWSGIVSIRSGPSSDPATSGSHPTAIAAPVAPMPAA